MKRRKITNPLWFGLQLGFFAGIFWGAVRQFFYILHFTSIKPAFLLTPFFRPKFLNSTMGQWSGYLSFIILSIIASLIYVLLFRHFIGPWASIIYGIGWWLIIFGLIGPFLNMTQRLNQLSWDTLSTEFCVFLLWGLFIGYTISVEFNDEQQREPHEMIA